MINGARISSSIHDADLDARLLPRVLNSAAVDAGAVADLQAPSGRLGVHPADDSSSSATPIMSLLGTCCTDVQRYRSVVNDLEAREFPCTAHRGAEWGL